MEKKIIDTIEVSWNIDHIDKNKDNLKKAIKAMPIWTLDKIDLDNKITSNIKSFDDKIHKKVAEKIKNHQLTSEQEIKLDWIILDLANKSNALISNMINSLDETFPNNDFLELESMWITEITNVLDGIKYYEKKKINHMSESEKLLASNDTGWFTNAYNKYGWVWWMIWSIFK
jgi:hypothetical protein